MILGATIFKKACPREKLVESLGSAELPSFPAVVLQVLEALRDRQSTSDAIAEKLAFDPSLSARILKLANSVALARRHPVKHVGQAVSLLGRAEVECLVLAGGVHRALPAGKTADFDPVRFWTSAARRAMAARAIAEKIHPQTRFESFTAAFLGDMAVPLLAHRRKEDYGAMFRAHSVGDGDLVTREREAFGWDHTEVGRSMSEIWGFPDLLSESIGVHHDLRAISDMKTPAVAIVGVLRDSDDAPDPEPLAEAAHAHLGLAKDDVVQLVENAWIHAADFADRLMG